MPTGKPDLPNGTPGAEFKIAKPELSPAVRDHLDNLQAQVSKILNKYGVSNFIELQTLGESDPDTVSKDDILLLTKLAGLISLAVKTGEQIKYSPLNLDNVRALVNESGETMQVSFKIDSRGKTTIVSFESAGTSENLSDKITQGVHIGVSENPDSEIARIEAEADLLGRLENAGLKPVENI